MILHSKHLIERIIKNMTKNYYKNLKKSKKKYKQSDVLKTRKDASFKILEILVKNTNLTYQCDHIVKTACIYQMIQTNKLPHPNEVLSQKLFREFLNYLQYAIFQELTTAYYKNDNKFMQDFNVTKKIYYHRILHIVNKIQENLFENYIYPDANTYSPEIMHCDTRKIKKTSVITMLDTLLNNYIECLQKVDIKKEMAFLKIYNEFDKLVKKNDVKSINSIKNEPLWEQFQQHKKDYNHFANFRKIKLQRAVIVYDHNNDEIDTKEIRHPNKQVTRDENGCIVLVNKYQVGMQYKILDMQLPAYLFALWVCTNIEIIKTYKKPEYIAPKTNSKDDYYVFYIVKRHFFEYSSVNLQYYINTYVLTLNIGNKIYYTQDDVNRNVLQLHIKADHIKELKTGDDFIITDDEIVYQNKDSYVVVDTNIIKYFKEFTEREYNIFINHFYKYIVKYQYSKDDECIFYIDILELCNKVLGCEHPTRLQKSRMHKIAKKILKVMQDITLPLFKTYNLTFKQCENPKNKDDSPLNKDIYRCVLKTEYIECDRDIERLKKYTFKQAVLNDVKDFNKQITHKSDENR